MSVSNLVVEELLQRGVREHQAGRRREAEIAYRQVLKADPHHGEALQMMGILAHEAGRLDLAANFVGNAVAAAPGNPRHRWYLGEVLQQSGRPSEAEASYRAALALQPAFAEAQAGLGGALMAQERPAEAEAAFRAALSSRPRDPALLNNLGAALAAQGRSGEAETAFRQALALAPGFAQALVNLGRALCALGRPAEAETPLRRATVLAPAEPDVHMALGVALLSLARAAEAEACMRQALRLNPAHADALINLAVALIEQERLAEAEAPLREALRVAPDSIAAHDTLASLLGYLGRVVEAERHAREATRLSPGDAALLEHHGAALFALRQTAQAESVLNAALALDPGRAQAETTLGVTLLIAGRLEQGWRRYEARWRTPERSAPTPAFAAPRWSGEPLAGRTLLLHAEQGLGDTLQFCRYAALTGDGGRVILQVQPALVRLMASLPGEREVIAQGQPPPAFDLQCPLLSLPGVFGTTLETIPAQVPYLAPDPAAADAWRRRLAALPGLKVGLVWAGNPRKGNAMMAAADMRRSLALSRLAPLATVAGVSFVSLQKGEAASQAASPPPGMALYDVTGELDDFADTAALVEALDLVISVDTSVVHLAGALGKPTWLLNRYDTCWRWLHDRDDSPWYPTLRQFRQPEPGDWERVIACVREALENLA
jgi:Flp pilus assembly protein TadD